MAVRLRPLTTDELDTIRHLAHARTAAARTVERARMIWLAQQGERVSAIAQTLGVGQATVRHWIGHFNAAGLDGLKDQPRSGRPPTYSTEQVGAVLASALTPPATLGQPFACWTLDRLVVYLTEERGITLRRSRLSELLRGEGLRWRSQETWFGERVDPAFAEKRGPSSRSTRRHLRKV